MSTPTEKKKKTIPNTVMLIGTFEIVVGLWVIFSMAVTRSWDMYIVLFAGCYVALGAGLLAMMEWARFAGVIVHLIILFYLLSQVASGHEAGFISAIRTGLTCSIIFALTRPYIRAKFQRLPEQ